MAPACVTVGPSLEFPPHHRHTPFGASVSHPVSVDGGILLLFFFPQSWFSDCERLCAPSFSPAPSHRPMPRGVACPPRQVWGRGEGIPVVDRGGGEGEGSQPTISRSRARAEATRMLSDWAQKEAEHEARRELLAAQGEELAALRTVRIPPHQPNQTQPNPIRPDPTVPNPPTRPGTLRRGAKATTRAHRADVSEPRPNYLRRLLQLLSNYRYRDWEPSLRSFTVSSSA